MPDALAAATVAVYWAWDQHTVCCSAHSVSWLRLESMMKLWYVRDIKVLMCSVVCGYRGVTRYGDSLVSKECI